MAFELADMIRQHPRFQKTAIIFISAVHLTDLDQLKAYQRGAVDYISVPIVPELLRAKVSVFADLHRKTRQMEMLNRELRTLSARLIATQDEERRRIARDLHDSVGQLVAALSMNNGLALPEAEKLERLQPTDALRQNTEITEQLSKEIRTISHLLHPPLLDEIGLMPAISMLANGFAERSNVKVAVELSPEIGRLAPNMEISIFRIVQECLTNVYRHSGSKTAHIKIWPSEEKPAYGSSQRRRQRNSARDSHLHVPRNEPGSGTERNAGARKGTWRHARNSIERTRYYGYRAVSLR